MIKEVHEISETLIKIRAGTFSSVEFDDINFDNSVFLSSAAGGNSYNHDDYSDDFYGDEYGFEYGDEDEGFENYKYSKQAAKNKKLQQSSKRLNSQK